MSYNHYHPFPATFGNSYEVDRRNDRLQSQIADHRRQLTTAATVNNSNDFETGDQLSRTSQSMLEFQPPMEIHENAETNTVTATFALPGIRKENVTVEVFDKETLVVSGEMAAADDREVNGEGFQVVHQEHRSGRFARSVRIPPGTTEADVKASMNHGILTITFPKALRMQSQRRTTVD